MVINYYVLFFVIFNLVNANIYKDLPRIFLIDNHEKCKTEGKLFCKVSIILKPSSQNVSHYWNLIQHSIENSQAYNHNELFHAICVEDFCPLLSIKSEINLNKTITECYNEKFLNLGLSADIISLNCNDITNVHKPDLVDCMWMLFCTIYLTYILIATYWDFHQGETTFSKRNFGTTYLRPFSLIRNYRKFKNIHVNDDFQKLKCIQGIRFYNMLLIIFCHTFSSYIGGYVKNTEYIEDIPNNPLRHGVRNLMVFLVQTFFLFSAFLMSYHFFQIVENEENNCHKFKVICLTFLNRYLRLVPLVIIMIGMGGTMWIISMCKGPVKDLYSDQEYLRCRKNWWTNLLFINNHYNHHDTCFFTTWYLAADTQLYLISLVIMGVSWKIKKPIKHFLFYFLILGIIIPIVISYVYNLDAVFRVSPENSKMNRFRSFKFNAKYSSTYSNMATYMIGLYFGYLYLRFKDVKINFSTGIKTAWYLFFLGLPIFVLNIAAYQYSRIVSALLSGILKPLYGIGIAMGVFGIVNGQGGVVRKICEWKPAILLGKLTYSTYIVHFGIVFYRTVVTTEPLFISDFVLLKSFIIDATLSFLFGFLVHILLELPASNMQNIWIPQVRCHRVKTKNEKDK